MARTDERDLRSALRTIREAVPDATTAEFQTSDQDTYGFVLQEVNLADGTRFSEVHPGGFDDLTDTVEQFINDLSWNGVMKEDRGGAATVEVPAEFDAEQAAEDAYMGDLLTLIDGFNYQRCETCGNDLNRHTLGPDALGKPHAYCLDSAD